MANKSNKSTAASTPANEQSDEQVAKNLGGNKAGLDQKPKVSMAQEGVQGGASNVGRERGQPEPSPENTSPMADKIEAEKLAQYEKQREENENA